MPKLNRKLVSYATLILIVASLPGCFVGNKGYKVSSDGVSWAGKKIEGADHSTFEWIRNSKAGRSVWGRDAKRVYYRDIVVPEADRDTFEVIPEMNSYARDCKHAFVGFNKKLEGGRYLPEEFSGLENDLFQPRYRAFASAVKIVNGADGATFRYMGSGWFRDKNHVFRRGKLSGPPTLFTEADAGTFHQMKQHGREWYVDRNHVFIGDEILEHADPNSYRVDPDTRDNIDDRFVYRNRRRLEVEVDGEMIPVSSREWRKIGRGYRTDGEFVFQDSSAYKLVAGADGPSFELLENGFAKDRNQAYYRGFALVGSESDSFEVVSPAHARDKNCVWHRRERMEGADPASFRAIDDHWSVDSHYVWQGAFTFNKTADPNSFEVLGLGYRKDRKHVWKGSKLVAADPATFEFVDGKPRDKHGPVR